MPTQSNFKPYILKAKLSWFSNNPVLVKVYRYVLTQYTPSVYADIYIVLNENDFNDFKMIDSYRTIDQRLITIWFEPELYCINSNKSYNSGPFTYCVMSYQYSSDYQNETDTIKYNGGKTRLIHLMCVDPVFYRMSLYEKKRSFGKVPASDVVKTIVADNGGTSHSIVATNYPFRWIQPRKTDYEMIRSILPYSRSINGDLLYTFFMNNKEAYFAPISAGKDSPVKIIFGKNPFTPNVYDTEDLKLWIEKYGGKDIQIAGPGFSNYSSKKPYQIKTESQTEKLSGLKQHFGAADTCIDISIEDETLQQIFLSNFRHRIMTFSRLIHINTMAIPELTPIDSIEIINETDGNRKDLDGLYYIVSVAYTYCMTNESPTYPMMSLFLCSELDMNSVDAPEGGNRNYSDNAVNVNSPAEVISSIKSYPDKNNDNNTMTSSKDIVNNNVSTPSKAVIANADTGNTTVNKIINTVINKSTTILKTAIEAKTK
jgi:hypothetical protein